MHPSERQDHAPLGTSVRAALIKAAEGLEETLELLSDPRAMRRIRKARAEIAAGEVPELTKEQTLALVRGGDTDARAVLIVQVDHRADVYRTS